jgi:hypothetical protein
VGEGVGVGLGLGSTVSTDALEGAVVTLTFAGAVAEAVAVLMMGSPVRSPTTTE